MSFEQIEHTADVGILAKGNDLEDAFRETARGMFSIITDLDGIGETGEYRVELTADDWESLLINFLSELIYLHEVKDVLFSDFDIELGDNGEKKIIAKGKGERIDFDRHELYSEIKAVSYHGVDVDEEGEIRVIFDV